MQREQALVDRWVKRNGGYWPPEDVVLRLVEEVGELAEAVGKCRGRKNRKPASLKLVVMFGELVRAMNRGKRKRKGPTGSIAEESGDALFTLCCLVNPRGTDLGAALRETVAKYSRRDRPHRK